MATAGAGSSRNMRRSRPGLVLRVETWADYERLPDDAAGPLCEGTRLGRWLNAEVGRREDVA